MSLRVWWLTVAVLAAIVAIAGIDLVAIAGDDGAAARPLSSAWPAPLVRRVIPIVEAAAPPPVPASPRIRLAAHSVAIPVQHVRTPVIGYCPIILGGLEPPADVHQVCYWAGGARVGDDIGTTVLTGHINWAGVTGAFGNLAALHPGELVYTSDAHRDISTWRIVRVEHRAKTLGIDPTAFVGHSGPRRLYLISCGGAFDAAEASYVDNIYVRARPVLPPPLPPLPPRPPLVE
jgi:hypothetical protein